MRPLLIAQVILAVSMTVWIGCIVGPMIASLLGDKEGVVFWGVMPVASVAIAGLFIGAALHLIAQAIAMLRQRRDGQHNV